MTAYWAQHAYLAPKPFWPGGFAQRVRFEIEGGVFTAIEEGVPQGSAHVLPGVVLPGLANCHSHAFHRALRGRTHAGGGTFWTWREAMYAVAAQLDPDNYLALARATYAEMALSGVTSVGEFHYVHHQPGGAPYDDPNAMGRALIQAAADAGIRLTLLDTCYLSGGLGPDGHTPLAPEQLRFADGDVMRWADRVSRLETDYFNHRIGTALHSVRAVPREQLAVLDQVWQHVVDGERVLHAHVSEQPAENQACQEFYGMTPVELLADAGLLGPSFSAVHATHLTTNDIALLGDSRSTACFCPTTERDLADGIGPARALLDAGAPLSLGSDQHAVIDLLEEARALEMHERLATLQRGRITQDELLTAATAHESIGWSDCGSLAVGARADLVAVSLDSVRTAGVPADFVLTAATAGDVTDVIRDGQVVVADRQHRLGDVNRLLSEAIEPFWADA